MALEGDVLHIFGAIEIGHQQSVGGGNEQHSPITDVQMAGPLAHTGGIAPQSPAGRKHRGLVCQGIHHTVHPLVYRCHPQALLPVAQHVIGAALAQGGDGGELVARGRQSLHSPHATRLASHVIHAVRDLGDAEHGEAEGHLGWPQHTVGIHISQGIALHVVEAQRGEHAPRKPQLPMGILIQGAHFGGFWLMPRTVGIREEHDMIHTSAADEPQVALLVGHTIGERAQRIGGGIRLLPAIGLATGDGTIAMHGPQGSKAVGILIGIARDECLSAPVFLAQEGHLGKPTGAYIKLEEAFIHHAAYIARGQHEDIAEAIVGHVAAIAHLSLEDGERLSVETAQSIPGGNPDEALPVLYYFGDMRRRQSVAFVIPGNLAFRRCPQAQAPQADDT